MSTRALTLVPLLALAPLARASEQTHTVTAGPIAIGGTGSIALPQFDPAIGVLRFAEITVAGRVSGTWSVENTTGGTLPAFGYSSGQYVGALVLESFGGPFPSPVYGEDPVVQLPPFDGLLDFAGPSAATRTFAGVTGDGNPSTTYSRYTDEARVAYIGTGTTSMDYGPIGQLGPNVPSGLASQSSLSLDLTVTVRYVYDPLPTAICLAAVWSGCPCNNVFGSGVHGCGNSHFLQGGTLLGNGATSLSADTFVLSCSNVTNSNALYFQGTSFSHVQGVYGDGLRCVAGSVARLGTKTNASFGSQYPGPGDVPISVRGGIAAPGTRYYQVVYRDGGAGYCTPALFNATNGWAVVWSP